MTQRYLGIDLGAEALELVELTREGEGLRWSRRARVEHHKEPGAALLTALADWGWDGLAGAAACGRLARSLALPRVPEKQARAAGFRYLHPEAGPTTLVSIGSHGFSVLELRRPGLEVLRENSRCSQGTGNFLRQLVERFGLDVAEASALSEGVEDPCPLSGRCPVILKTDMTHLANQGQGRERILAGLYDAVAENVQVLVKPKLGPRNVALLGGVSRAPRLREHFRRFLARQDMELLPWDEDCALYVDALGAALHAAEQAAPPAPLEQLLRGERRSELEHLPGPRQALSRVRRLQRDPLPLPEGEPAPLVLGFDIGSTGSKAVAVEAATGRALWQGYLQTEGNPVQAAQQLLSQFLAGPWGAAPLQACGATGSGREIVGSLLRSCYGSDAVFVLNEIAAHAEGALSFDPRVDTIFEIGGQDAKYIRLAEGRVVDAAMNEACSAGTGSFIEEQGRRFAGIRDVVQLSEEALQAADAISLGQHCSVFMAEIIDEAVAAGHERPSIFAGIYDSIIQNYLNRVKGSRSVGQVVFCQGMPFASDALAAAVARQTGAEVVVPPDPGTIGALGIALLTRRAVGEALEHAALAPLDPQRFLSARIVARDHFVCRSTQGCGGKGNLCRIDRIRTEVAGVSGRFVWGGACSLYDRGTGRNKLPDLAPDPFRQREELVDELLAPLRPRRGGQRIALTDEFTLKGMMPFFARLLWGLGYDLELTRGADQGVLKRGVEEANVPFCAPMQQYHGLVAQMLDTQPDLLFLPMLRSLERVGSEPRAVLCPVVQASPDLLRSDLAEAAAHSRIVSPVLDVGEAGVDSPELRAGLWGMARDLGCDAPTFAAAFAAAVELQQRFDRACLAFGQAALDFCQAHDVVPVVVLGRPYTIYNKVLNSNVPAILREQGALAIPVDCYPVDPSVPVFEDVFWAHGQRNLRAAHQVRRRAGVWSLWCSNYSCGPDSFNLHFYSYLMEGKPWAVVETDGHSGDAGTKTRVEAFLYCVQEDRRQARQRPRPRSFKLIELDREGMVDVRRRGETVLIPRMGPGAESFAACLRGAGIPAEALPLPDREALALGRRHTSGKECVPMTLTLGSLLQRLNAETDPDRLFSFFMPTAKGPCRFGVYNLLHKIVLEREGHKDRVRIWAPEDKDYFAGVPGGFVVLAYCGFMAADLLLEALYDVRPAETEPGVALRLHQHWEGELLRTLERAGAGRLDLAYALAEVATGRFFGVRAVLEQAAAAFARVKRDLDLPTCLAVGEIYVRCDPFANDFAIDRLEELGVRVRFAPFTEWLEYVDFANAQRGILEPGAWLRSQIQASIQDRCYRSMADALGWAPRSTVPQSVAAAGDYLRPDLEGEAVLTVGGPVHEWRAGLIDGVISLGPLECMPTKIAEAQLFHAAEREGLISLTLALNGDPVDPELLESFAFELTARHAQRKERSVKAPTGLRARVAAALPGRVSRRRAEAALGQGLRALRSLWPGRSASAPVPAPAPSPPARSAAPGVAPAAATCGVGLRAQCEGCEQPIVCGSSLAPPPAAAPAPKGRNGHATPAPSSPAARDAPHSRPQ